MVRSNPKLLPLPSHPIAPAYPPVNAGNTCYLDALLVALFASCDAYDPLLTSPPLTSAHAALQTALVAFINALRLARPPTAAHARAVRTALVSLGWPGSRGQQDAAELFAFLLDALRAPFVPLYSRLSHHAAPDVADNAPSTERLIWLPAPSPARSPRHAEMRRLLHHYFHGEVRRGVRRGEGPVDARVTRSLLPWYTPVRETGETSGGTRQAFRYLTVPLALSRFKGGDGKSRAAVGVQTALPASQYVGNFGVGAAYTLILRSVVCHLGDTIRSGHYVAYTFDARVGWRRWNDLDSSPVRAVRGDVATGLPEEQAWATEIERDCYLLFYELVPGDGDVELGKKAKERQERKDAKLAAQTQEEEDMSAAIREQMREVTTRDKMDKFWSETK